jgi:hypothetical protein
MKTTLLKALGVSSAFAVALLAAAPVNAAPPPASTSQPATASKPAQSAPTAMKERTATGVVKAYDDAKKTLTLENGRKYRIGSSVPTQSYTPGEKVNVRWMLKDKHRVAESITASK